MNRTKRNARTVNPRVCPSKTVQTVWYTRVHAFRCLGSKIFEYTKQTNVPAQYENNERDVFSLYDRTSFLKMRKQQTRVYYIRDVGVRPLLAADVVDTRSCGGSSRVTTYRKYRRSVFVSWGSSRGGDTGLPGDGRAAD